MEEFIQKAIESASKICGKGEPVLITGTTGAGKTTSVTGLSDEYITQQYLALGEAQGKGSLKSRFCIATDHSDIPTGCIVVRAKLKVPGRDDYGDDLNFFGNMVYSYINAIHKKSGNPEKTVISTAVNRIKNPPDGNASLEAKLDFILDNNDRMKKLVNLVVNMDTEHKKNCLTTLDIARQESKKGQKVVKNFIRKLSSDSQFNNIIDQFWKLTDDFLGSEVHEIREILKSAGAEFDNAGDGTFTIVFSEDVFDDNIDESSKKGIIKKAAHLLIHSENNSAEHLLSDINIIFRASDEIFECDKNDNRFVVMENKGNPVRVIRLIDTMGLFHLENDPKEEASRITDLMKSNYCSQGIIVINSFINDTTKKGYTALKDFFQDFNGNSKFYLLFTHWDEYLKTFGGKNSTKTGKSSRFGQKLKVVWTQEYETAENQQKKLIKTLHDALERNNSSHKPVISEESFASCMIIEDGAMENVLRDKEMEYNLVWKRMIKAIHRDQIQHVNKIRVDANIINKIYIDFTKINAVKVQALRSNLLDCINCTDGNNRLWAPTANAVKRHWSENGNEFHSNVTVTEGGYCNIKTTFISEIRKYAENYLSAIICADGMVNPTQAKLFEIKLRDYLKQDQKFGRETAKEIYRWSARYVKNHNIKWYLQYEYVNRVFRATANNLFFNNSQVMQPNMESIFTDTLKTCIRNFINQYCITF